jgi:hypothetical protein
MGKKDSMKKKQPDTTRGVVGSQYELDEADAPEIDLPGIVENFESDIPDHALAEKRRLMLRCVAEGADPDRVARVFHYDNWRNDPVFSDLVARAEEAAIATVEMRVWKIVATGGSLPTGLQFWLKARAGYNDRPSADNDDGTPQEVRVNREIVRGDTKEDPAHAA